MSRRTPEPRAVLTTDGMIVRGDTDDRPGDPIVTRMGVRTVERVLPPVVHPTSHPDCVQDELPLVWD